MAEFWETDSMGEAYVDSANAQAALRDMIQRLRAKIRKDRDKALRERERPNRFTRPAKAASGAYWALERILNLPDWKEMGIEDD
jgi:hypothetical protein